MANSEQTTNEDSESWELSPCPVCRSFQRVYGGLVSHADLKKFFRRVGLKGPLFTMMVWLGRFLGRKDGLRPANVENSFIVDSACTGITRFGTNLQAIDTLFGLIDTDNPPGQRRIRLKDLARFGAIIRAATPWHGILGIRRNYAITMTIVEWKLLIHMFGDRTNGSLAINESDFLGIVEGELPSEDGNSTTLLQALCAMYYATTSLFVRLNRETKSTVRKSLGPAAEFPQ